MIMTTVSGALRAFIKSEKLTDGNEWICDGCKKKVHVRTLLEYFNTAPITLQNHQVLPQHAMQSII